MVNSFAAAQQQFIDRSCITIPAAHMSSARGGMSSWARRAQTLHLQSHGSSSRGDPWRSVRFITIHDHEKSVWS